MYLYKCIISNSDSNISIKIPTRETRSTNATNGILLEVAKCKTVSYQNSFYVRVANVWNTLPCLIRETNKTMVSFKFCLMQHFSKEIYNPEDLRKFKSVCVNCHTSRPLTNLQLPRWSVCMRETPSNAPKSNAPRKILKIWVSDMEFPTFHSQDTIYSRLLHFGYCNQIAFTHQK